MDLREKIGEVLNREKKLEQAVSDEGTVDHSNFDEVEEELLQLVETEQEEVERVLELHRNSLEWRNSAEKALRKSRSNIQDIIEEADSGADLPETVLRETNKISERLSELGEKPVNPEDLPEERRDYHETLKEIEDTYKAVQELETISKQLSSREGLSNREKKRLNRIEHLASELEEVEALENEETREIDFRGIYRDAGRAIEIAEEINFEDERVGKAVKATLEQVESLAESLGQVEKGSGISRRDFLVLVAGAAGAAVSMKYTYDSMKEFSELLEQRIEQSEERVERRQMSRTGKFLRSYAEEISSIGGSLELSSHVIVAENHQFADGLPALIQLMERKSPDAVGLEFFYRQDEVLMSFNRGEASVSDVLNHWIQTEEDLDILGRGRDENLARRFLETAREHGVDLHGLEPERRGYYDGESYKYLGEEGYLERSRGMSRMAAELAGNYSSTLFFVGYFHASKKAVIPFLLPRAGNPEFEGEFGVEKFLENPYLVFLRGGNPENSGKDYTDFHEHPELRFNVFLSQQGIDSSTVLATSAEEQRFYYQRNVSNYPEQTRQEEDFRTSSEMVEQALKDIEQSQPLEGVSRSGLQYILHEEH